MSSACAPVEVPPLVMRAVRELEGRGRLPRDAEGARAAFRRRGFLYASIWAGNHAADFARGLEHGFTEPADEEGEM